MYGNIFKRRRITENYCHSREYYQQFGAHIDTFIRSLNISPKRVLGVGIALTALLSKDRQHIAKSVLLGTTEAQLADFKRISLLSLPAVPRQRSRGRRRALVLSGITDALYLGLNHHLNGMLIMNRKIHAGKGNTAAACGAYHALSRRAQMLLRKVGLLQRLLPGHLLVDDQTRDYEHFFQLLRSGSREESEKWQLF